MSEQRVELIDTHTHLESFVRRGELETVVQRAADAGVRSMITIGTSSEDWGLYREIAEAGPGQIYFTAGLHPCSVDEHWPEQVATLATFWSASGRARPVALGECGLDRFHLPKDDTAAAAQIFEWQQAAFAAQLAMARSHGTPVVVHSRGAFDDCVRLVDASGVDWAKVVFHCFAEGPEAMAVLQARGGFGSFTGILTYKSAEVVRAAALAQGLERCLLETDAPYLTPMPHRGKPNEPAYLRHTAEFAATHVFRQPLTAVAAATTAHARRFFNL